MPYFGRATLASILVALADVPLARRSGQGILNALDRLNEHSDEEAPFAAAARQMLAHVSYVEAACWITACLADALQYAHEHNLVHLDVKPSNILLSNDGQPMLLDFHLAREPLEGAGILSDQLGGTPGYMSPEHEAAMRSLSECQPVTSPVDQRADVFALGAVLYELLGAAPASQKTGSNTLCRANPHVSAGLAGIVAKCLAPVATDRYVSAAALAEDLRRHLTDQPLLGAPNRDWSERWQKWQRRHTHALRVSGTLSVVAMAVALTVMGFWSQFRQRSTSAEQALLQGQTLLQQQHAAEAAATFERGLTSIEDVPLRHDLGRQLRTQLAIARRMIVTDKLHQLADQVRVLAGSESLPAEQLRAVSALCVEFWDQREKILTSLHVERETDVAADLLDVAMFAADVQLRLVPANLGAARVSAIRTLDEAEALFGRSPVLDYQRCLLRGHNSEECRLSLHEITSIRRANDNTRSPAWDHYALGRAFLNSSELDLAAEELRIAVAINPASLWPNFYHGLCAHRLGRYHEAIAAFSVCIGVAPQLAACYHNRGISHAALGHTAAALLDESRAVELAPNLAATWLNSAMLHHKPGEYSAADADLQQAFYHRVDPTTHKREH